MHLEEKKLSGETIFDGKIIHVVRDKVLLENGKEADREVVIHSGGVAVVPINNKAEVLLVKQYRYPHGRVMLEIPAGKLEPGEKHYDCGKRELLEETGCTCKRYTYMGEVIPTPAYVSEVIHMYLATELEYKEQDLDENEFLDVVKIPLEKAYRMVLDGEIADSKTQIGIMKAYCSIMRVGV